MLVLILVNDTFFTWHHIFQILIEYSHTIILVQSVPYGVIEVFLFGFSTKGFHSNIVLNFIFILFSSLLHSGNWQMVNGLRCF